MTPKKCRTQNLNTATGSICTDHLLATTGTAILSIVSKRLLYLTEVKRRLDHHGLSSVLHNTSDLWKRLFLINQDKVDASCVLPLLHPQLSERDLKMTSWGEHISLPWWLPISRWRFCSHWIWWPAYSHEDSEELRRVERICKRNILKFIRDRKSVV